MPHPSRSSPAVLRLLLLAAAILGAAPARGGEPAPPAPPWESQPFAAPAPEVLKAAAALVAGEEDEEEDVVVLLEEGRYTFDADGRCDYRYRMVFRLQTEAAVRDWASLETSWSPWYEERPEFRARVSTPDGEAHLLDPRTVAEAPAEDDDPTIYRDRRRLRAPLPGVVVGAVVEEEIRTRDRLPLFAAGTTYSFALGSGTPTRRARVVIEAPPALPLHHALHGLPDAQVTHERLEGRERYVVEVGPLKAVPDAEPWMPSDRPRRPYLAFATGASWQQVAAAYSRVIDTQTAVPPVAALRAGVKREEVAARLLEKLHKQVRYTGVEFGEASLVPRSPAEVLSHRYGDCKDTASLLVSQLRHEGIPAYVALLSAGPGADIDPRLPGLGSFDHAIVVMPGPPALWIDTTNEFARVNELPLGDQDRLALVAAPETDALLRTPVAEPAVNVVRKTREYLLAESGPGRVIETTQAGGQPEMLYRSYYAETAPKDRRESQEKYARLEHESTSVVNASHSDPRALGRPFELRVESAGAKRADTSGSTATVLVNVASLFSRLPDAVDDETAARRAQAFVMPEPHRVELNYRIVPPKGFEVRALPDPVKESLGPAALEVNFTAGPDGAVSGRLTFDTGARVMDPAAYDELKEKVRGWRAHELLAVKFEHKAQALLDAGRTCEGLGELRLSADADPAHAAPRERLATGLLQAGLGEAAREEARRAVASEPTASTARRTLGWVLEHDLLGRRFKPGADRAGAEAAYREALKLDAANTMAASSLAILLEHDEQGTHFGEGARLADAVVEEERLRKDLSYSFLNVNLMLSLLHLGRFAELEKLARSLPAEADRNEILISAVAAQRGADEALAEAARLFPAGPGRRDALLHSGNSLVSLRLYPQAAALLAASVSGADDAAARRGRADVFARVRRYEEMALDPADPRTAVKRMVIAVAEYLAGKAEPAAFLDYAALEPGLRDSMEGHLDDLRRGVLAGVRSSAAALSRDVVDVALSIGDFGLEGDADGGYRAQFRAGGRSSLFYLGVRDGRALVLIDRPAEAAMAREAWRLFDAGDEERGWRWLDWVRDALPEAQPRDPLARDAFLALWRPAGARSLVEGRVAAASLFTRPPQLEMGIRTLAARSASLPDGADRQAVDLALFRLYQRTGRFAAEALRLLEGFATAFPESRLALALRVSVLFNLERGAEAQALVAERLRARPDDEQGLRLQASVALRQGRFDEAERAFARLAELGRSEADDLNNRAWTAVLRGAVDDSSAEWARQAAQGGEAATLHTLATVYAEKGRVKEALEVLGQSVRASGDEIRAEDWYVIGRVAESCGLTAQARRAYERLMPLKDVSPDSTGRLATRALARLTPPAPTNASRAKRP